MDVALPGGMSPPGVAPRPPQAHVALRPVVRGGGRRRRWTVAGSLQTEGGFAATESGSAKAKPRSRRRPAAGGARRRRPDARPTPRRRRRQGHAAEASPGSAAACADGQPRRPLGLPLRHAKRRRRRGRRDRRSRASASRDSRRPARRLGVRPAPDRRPVSEDLGRAELLAFPILLLLSLLFFRGRATVLPLAVGMTTVLGTFLVLTVVNQVYHLSIFALNLVIGLGLGLAIDYTLFLVTRFREELAARASAGRCPHDDEHRRPHRRVQRGDRRARADHADRLPARLPAVDGDRRRGGRPRRRRWPRS